MTRLLPAASVILSVILAVTILPVLAAFLIFLNAAVADFLVPFGLSFSVALRPAAVLAVALVSLIALLTPLIFTVPLAVARMRRPAGARTVVRIDRGKRRARWRLLRATVHPWPRRRRDRPV